MFVIYIFLFGLTLFVCKLKDKKYLSVLTIFGISWCLFPALSCLGLLGMNPPSTDTHFLIVLAWLSFLIGYLLTGSRKIKTNFKKRQANQNILLIGNLIALVILIPHLTNSLRVLGSEGWSSLRTIAGETYSNSTLINILNDWFTEPFIIASSAYFAICLFSKKRLPLLLSALIVTNVGVSCLVFAARALLIKILFFVVFSWLFLYGFKSYKKLPKMRFIVMLLSIALFAFVAVYITGLRMNETNIFGTFSQSALPYYIGPFSLIDYYVNNPNISFIGIDYTYGGSFFGFIYNVFRAILYILFGAQYNGTDYTLTLVTQFNSPIGGGYYINAAPTALYPMLRDFGTLGVLFGFLLLGIIYSFIERQKNAHRGDDLYSMIYVFLCYVLFKTSMNYEPLSPSFLFTIVFCFVICFGKYDKKSKVLVPTNI